MPEPTPLPPLPPGPQRLSREEIAALHALVDTLDPYRIDLHPPLRGLRQLLAHVAALEGELFDYAQIEKLWNEADLMRSNTRWFEEAKRAHAALDRVATITPEILANVLDDALGIVHPSNPYGRVADLIDDPCLMHLARAIHRLLTERREGPHA